MSPFIWAHRLCSLCPTWFPATESIVEDNLRRAAPWWLGFDAAAQSSVSGPFQPCFDLPGTDSQLISRRDYLTRKSANCTVHTFTTAVQAGRRGSAFANLWGRRQPSLKVSWRHFTLAYSPLMRHRHLECKFNRHQCLSTGLQSAFCINHPPPKPALNSLGTSWLKKFSMKCLQTVKELSCFFNCKGLGLSAGV